MSDSPNFELTGKSLGGLGKFESQNIVGKKADKRDGSLANTITPPGGVKEINVVKDYVWTLTNINNPDLLSEIPYIRLIEYKRTEGSLKLQASFYTRLVPQAAGNLSTSDSDTQSILKPYKEMWPKDNPTNWIYKFPYFSKKGFELSTNWEELGEGGTAVKGIASGIAGMLGGSEAAKQASKALNAIEKIAGAKQAYDYPSIGAKDRPRVFSKHGERSIEVSFTLYNTNGPNDWMKNRDLVYLLMSQNLFNKRDLTTGAPPVWYEVWVPGQYYSYASCISNLNIEHLGNQRLLYNEYVVPDAYQVNLTLQELVQPSKNQFEALINGMARSKVTSSVVNGRETLGFQDLFAGQPPEPPEEE